MGLDDHFTTGVVETYVDTGWEDEWGCRDEMKAKLDDGAHTAAQKLKEALDGIMPYFAKGPRAYSTSITSLRDFNLVSGGNAIVNAP